MKMNFRENGLPFRIHALGQSEFESLTNSEVAEMLGVENQGQVWNARNAVSLKTGWKLGDGDGERKVRQAGDKPRKLRGSLPLKIQGYLEATCEEVPEVWEPEQVLEVVLDDSAGWNRLIRRLADADPAIIESFELWLDHAATVSRTVEFEASRERARLEATRAKIEALARQILELDDSLKGITVGYLSNLTIAE
jgi:hypothetical protein